VIRRALVLACLMAGVAQAQVPEPEGFRGPPYKAEVPATLQGAKVIDAERALVMHGQGSPFLDTMPRTRKPENLPAGTIWREPAHETIPGAIWLWDTGYEKLSPSEEARLENGLETATGGDKSAPLVIFCRADCWMSWNAAKRAVSLGYSAVNWFPGGSDGWLEAGGDGLVTAEPVAP
jgi:PQQ-dependent catabolism-associated CXXCW motif protein